MQGGSWQGDAGAMPAILQSWLVTGSSRNKESKVEKSLQQKAYIEHWRNKMRLRQRARSAQSVNISDVLGADNYIPPPTFGKGKGRRRLSKRAKSKHFRNELDQLYDDGTVGQYRKKDYGIEAHLPELDPEQAALIASHPAPAFAHPPPALARPVSSAPFRSPSASDSGETLADSRKRMSKLLDNAFSLVHPRFLDKVAGDKFRQQYKRFHDDQLKDSDEGMMPSTALVQPTPSAEGATSSKTHLPMLVNTKPAQAGGPFATPYKTSDELAWMEPVLQQQYETYTYSTMDPPHPADGKSDVYEKTDL
ncbi:uncharacterized protein LOC135492389 isoform X2 [Lineus longissimus]|uniref:uncharacterized protein LOC135492389 isoform X2 n=1 Tax=Lineus longissimus TaxID=88925 RepID=UPI00315CD596